MKTVIPDPPCLEDSLLHVMNVLRSAAATAYECADSLSGSQRDLAFSTHHLIDLARSVLDDALSRLETV
ncbi:DUF3077 domain-containing protein [Pseudomonas syringae]|uniref:DUF6124 family protein n=1 Tax=Pseudomonas ovata TaxID=1839709 RepID=UPI000D68E3A7|nr:DUF3077 domain-containing protein [Pseudomonas ovata]MBD8495138.1 DUF3077 domain-containing protein [Pseudomonas syringae]MBD8573790.1 DUF3077 domain-containing protein [Pseudomonas syringae]MBD8792639.1 DUF3077 domain-containing protein [Pseudomonas syringae]MBD8802951.1 DUF3077 domain-containing protein [Pseudomonas syringae]MBD8813719.1 DUF3077 domain-containing protein [Pseudomonas syringae]